METNNTFIPVADKIFDYYICRKYNGFYFEAGCNDGVQQSNTLRLERERGWSGILCDASPDAIETCAKNRSVNTNMIVHAALSTPENDGKLLMGDWDGHLMGSQFGQRLNRPAKIAVPATTITTILKKHGVQVIDLMILDLEGREMEALTGMDFTYCHPRIMLIEANGDPEPMVKYLRQKGYYGRNYSQFTQENNPTWDGTHNDYLFERVGDCWD